MQHKKIIISSYDELKNPYYAGGGAVAIHEIAKRLDQYSAVTIFCGKYPGYKDYTSHNIHYKHIGLEVAGRVGQLIFQLFLPYFVKNESYDLWIESFTPPFSTGFLPLFTAVPVIGLTHMLSGQDMRRKYKIPFDLIESFGLKFYKHFIVLTGMDKKKIERINPSAEIAAIPNGVNLSRNTQETIDRKHILYIGRIEIDQKGLDILIDAYHQMITITNYPLVIAGNGTKKEIKKLRMLIKKFHLNHRIKLLGKVGQKKKNILYQQAVCVVIPSRFETFSLVALESFSRKRVIVTFAIPGLSWIPNAYRVVAGEMKATLLKDAILSMVNNQPKRKKIEESLGKFVKKFNWDVISKKYIFYINNILKKGYQ